MEGQQPIRVAHIVGKMVGGGVEAFIMNYYRNIDRTKVQFDFIIDSDSKVVPKEEIEKLGGRIIIVPPYQKVFSYIKELRKILNENKYKIVHSHLNSLSVIPLFGACLAKVPVRIAHSHSTTNIKEWKKNLFKNILRPFSKVFATHYFACSEHAGRWLFGNRTFNNGKVKIITNAIDIEKFDYNIQIREKFREKLNVEGKIVIGHIGRFVKQKNHEYLIEIFAKAKKINNNLILLLIGEGPLENKIKNEVEKLGLSDSVLFLGVVNDVYNYLQVMDCFAFPSLYEGLGIVLIEAQCNGLTCLCSKEIPEEARMSSSFKKIDINNQEEWIKNICEPNNYKRYDYKDVIKKNGYDIKKEANLIEKEYIKLFMKGQKI